MRFEGEVVAQASLCPSPLCKLLSAIFAHCCMQVTLSKLLCASLRVPGSRTRVESGIAKSPKIDHTNPYTTEDGSENCEKPFAQKSQKAPRSQKVDQEMTKPQNITSTRKIPEMYLAHLPTPQTALSLCTLTRARTPKIGFAHQRRRSWQRVAIPTPTKLEQSYYRARFLESYPLLPPSLHARARPKVPNLSHPTSLPNCSFRRPFTPPKQAIPFVQMALRKKLSCASRPSLAVRKCLCPSGSASRSAQVGARSPRARTLHGNYKCGKSCLTGLRFAG